MKHRIKLLQIVDSLHPGGMENIMVQVCNGLDPTRFQVTVACLSTEGPFAERLDNKIIKKSLDKQPGFQRQTVRQLRELMSEGFDVIHTHHLGGLIYAALAKGLGKGPKIVHSEHILWDAAELHWKRQLQRRILYRLTACIFTVSNQQLIQMRDLGHRHSWQTSLINGVDASRFQPPSLVKAQHKSALGLDPDCFWIGKVARFGETKRHRELISAFELAVLKEPRLRLLLIGDGGLEKQAVLNQIESSPARDQFRWAGFQQNPEPWYQAMDALVVASSFEGLPNAVLEAMSCGLPILANDVCGLREVAEHGAHGWIEDLSSVERLAGGLVKIAQADKAELHRMGAAATAHVRERFSMQAMLKKYDQLYTAVAEGRKTNIETPTHRGPI